MKIVNRFVITFLPGMSILVFWYWLSNSGFISNTTIATPDEVLNAITTSFQKNATPYQKIHLHVLHSMSRALTGWWYSILIGLPIGIIIGRSKVLYRSVEPIIEFFRSIPPVLVFPLFLVVFNFNSAAYIWCIFLGCFPVFILTIARGTSQISLNRLEVLNTYQVAKGIKYFVLGMEILPSIFLGARVTLSIAIIISVVTEMVFTPNSGFAIGALARDAELGFDTPVFYACLLVVGFFGYFSNLVLKKTEEFLE